MTTTAGSRPGAARGGGHEDDLARYLPRTSFPAPRDELLATLVRRHAPSRYVWEVSRLPAGRVFTGVADVLGACAAPAATEVHEPW